MSPSLDHNLDKDTSIFILSPNADTIFSRDNIRKIKNAGNLVIVKTPQPVRKVKALFQGTQPRILALDPDFCGWKFPTPIIDQIPNLETICLQTASFDWIDIEFAKTKNIPVTNLRGFASCAVAEWAIMMALNIARKLPPVIKDKWKYDYKKHQGIELKGKTAGIIGLGRIGKRIAEICRGLGMNVQYWSQNSRDKRFDLVTPKKLFATSNFIFPTLSKNNETKRIITDDLLLLMKTSTILVTIFPLTKIYNHELVLELAKQKKIYGYAFEEGLTPGINVHRGNILDSPTMAWVTKESQKRNSNLWTKNIINAAKGKFTNKVN